MHRHILSEKLRRTARLVLVLVAAFLAVLPVAHAGGFELRARDAARDRGLERYDPERAREVEIARRALSFPEPTAAERVGIELQNLHADPPQLGTLEPLWKERSPALKIKLKPAVHDLSLYVARSTTVTVKSLLDHQYVTSPPWMNDPQWEKLSISDQVEQLVQSAAEVSPQNAEKLLAIMSQNLARNYKTVEENEHLRPFLNIKPEPPPVGFVRETATKKFAPLDSKLQAAVRVLADYLERGGQVSVKDLGVIAGMSEDDAKRVHIKHIGSPEAALTEILDTAPKPPALNPDAAKSEITAVWAAHFARYYSTVKWNPDLKQFVKQGAGGYSNRFRQLVKPEPAPTSGGGSSLQTSP